MKFTKAETVVRALELRVVGEDSQPSPDPMLELLREKRAFILSLQSFQHLESDLENLAKAIEAL